MAMVHLAGRQMVCPRPVTLAEIAGGQNLSLAYLEQLFGPLRRAGLVVSARGPGGGYRLAHPPAAISIADIVCAVDEGLQVTRCSVGTTGCIDRPNGESKRCGTHALWHELGRHIHLFLGTVSLADVVQDRIAGRAAAPEPVGQTESGHHPS